VARTNAEVPQPVKPPPDLKPLLREIDAIEVADNRPPLSIVITEEPAGNGHSAPLVERASRFVSRGGRQPGAELRRAWDHWSATPPAREELSGERPGGTPQPPQAEVR
jgi:hypothetical protein